MGDEQPKKKIKISEGDKFLLNKDNIGLKNAEWVHFYKEKNEYIFYKKNKTYIHFYCLDGKTGSLKWKEKQRHFFLRDVYIKNGFFVRYETNKRFVYEGYEEYRDEKLLKEYDWSEEDIADESVYFYISCERYSRKHGEVYMILCESAYDDIENGLVKYTLFADIDGKRIKTEFTLPILSSNHYQFNSLMGDGYHTSMLFDINSNKDIIIMLPLYCILLFNQSGELILKNVTQARTEKEVEELFKGKDSHLCPSGIQLFLDEKDRIVVLDHGKKCYITTGLDWNVYAEIDVDTEYENHRKLYKEYGFYLSYTGKSYNISTCFKECIKKRNRIQNKHAFVSICYDSDNYEK